jgi:hypothetical protein
MPVAEWRHLPTGKGESMDPRTYDQFFSALDRIVNDDGGDKYAALKNRMSEKDESNIEELLSWFLDEKESGR